MTLPATDTLFRQAERGLLPLGELFQGAQGLADGGDPQGAVRLYETWLGHTPSPLAYAVWFNLAVARGNAGDDAGALRDYANAIALNPGFVEARLNLGTLYERMGRPDEALATWQAILTEVADLAAKPALHVQALNNLGRLYELRKRLPEAAEVLTRSLELDPDQPKVITHWVHLRQKLCLWPVYQPVGRVTVEQLRRHTSALAMLAASPDPAEQLAASTRFIEEKVDTGKVQRLSPGEGYAHRRMRIGYLSSDLCSHAVSILTAELYELHDRDRVEVYAFSWSREDNTPLRARVVGAMDHYIRIDHMTDEEAAHCIRAHEIDVLVDLHGLTLGSRVDILAWHPAPVQLTWLGFPGPTAIPGIDYVVADAFVLPPEMEPHFTERPLRMPNTFQINDRQRAIGPTPERAASGLPVDDSFVFCAFNSNFKITPEVFDAWMRILNRVPRSVLWIVADNEATRANLIREAEARGVDGNRLLFAQRVAPADYLARFRLADLFLDTNPFNGGTTASDALWAGLPVLTLAGQTFCARMAGSLLHAVGLPELVTHTLQDYEELAVALATDRARMHALRERLAANRDSSALFDTPRFVRDYEDALDALVVRPAGVPLDGTDAAATGTVPAPEQLSVQQHGMLALMRPGMHSVVEVGGATLAQAWRAGTPNSHYTAVAPALAAGHWGTALVARDPEQLDDADWQQLAPGQCWLFPETLERLRDPWAFLQRLRRQALGRVEIVACVGNAQNWLLQALLVGGNFNYQHGAMPDRRHLHLFTRASLVALLEECGFAVAAMTTVNAHQPPPQVVAALRALAEATGADPALAEQDALPYQYLVRAVAA